MGSFNETFKTFQRFVEEMEGNVICDCDHGCNQHFKSQRARLLLGIRMMKMGSKNLDKMASLPIEIVNRLYYWVIKQDNRRANEQLRLAERAIYRERCLAFGIDAIDKALNDASGDYKKAAETLGIKWYEIKFGHIEWQTMSEADKQKSYDAKKSWDDRIKNL